MSPASPTSTTIAAPKRSAARERRSPDRADLLLHRAGDGHVPGEVGGVEQAPERSVSTATPTRSSSALPVTCCPRLHRLRAPDDARARGDAERSERLLARQTRLDPQVAPARASVGSGSASAARCPVAEATTPSSAPSRASTDSRWPIVNASRMLRVLPQPCPPPSPGTRRDAQSRPAKLSCVAVREREQPVARAAETPEDVPDRGALGAQAGVRPQRLHAVEDGAFLAAGRHDLRQLRDQVEHGSNATTRAEAAAARTVPHRLRERAASPAEAAPPPDASR